MPSKPVVSEKLAYGIARTLILQFRARNQRAWEVRYVADEPWRPCSPGLLKAEFLDGLEYDNPGPRWLQTHADQCYYLARHVFILPDRIKWLRTWHPHLTAEMIIQSDL